MGYYEELPINIEEPIAFGLEDSTPNRPKNKLDWRGGVRFYPAKSYVFDMMKEEGWPDAAYLHPHAISYYWAQGYITISDAIFWKKYPLTPENFWRYKAAEKFQTGTWKKTYFNDASFYSQSGKHINLWLHQSEEEPSQVGVIPDNDYGQTLRVQRMKPGRFLSRYFPMDPNRQKEYINNFNARHASEGFELNFARTADEIEHVYENGPSSCMVMERNDRYISSAVSEHPVRMYATPDIGIAYIKNRKGSIQQRVVCNMVDETFTTIYGQGPLQSILESRGFHYGSIEGCRLRKVFCRAGQEYLMPYLDDSMGVREHDDNYWIATCEYDYECQQTSGYLNDNRSTCEDCGDRHHQDALTSTGIYDDRYVCDGCLQEYDEIQTSRGWRWLHIEDQVTVYESADREMETTVASYDIDNNRINVHYDQDTGDYFTEDAYNYLLELREREERRNGTSD